MRRYLIVTADDFGFSAERNKGIMEAFKNGAVKSASILFNCTGTDEAVQMSKSSSICPGLHLNLTEGLPLSLAHHKTLNDQSGEMFGKSGLPELLEAGKIDLEEVRREIDTQISRFKEMFGKPPVYVDGHQHIHLHPAVVDIFADALQRNEIRVTRYPIEINIDKKEFRLPWLKEFLLDMMAKTKPARSILEKHGVRTTDAFVGLSTMGSDMTIDKLQSIILEAFEAAEKDSSNVANGFVSCELMCHPGYATGEKFGGFSWGSDDFGCSPDREHEVKVLSSQEMMDFYVKNGIELVSHEKLLEPLVKSF